MSIEAEGMHTKQIRYNQEIRGEIKKWIKESIHETFQNRVDLINDPKEVIDSLEFEEFSKDAVEASFSAMQKKLGFSLP